MQHFPDAKLNLLAGDLRSVCGYAASADDLVYFDTRADGPGQGIYAARFDPQSGHLSPIGVVAEIRRPAWLMPHPRLPVLYSVSESGNDGQSESSVFSLAIDETTGALRVLNNVRSGGGGATHLGFDDESRSESGNGRAQHDIRIAFDATALKRDVPARCALVHAKAREVNGRQGLRS